MVRTDSIKKRTQTVFIPLENPLEGTVEGHFNFTILVDVPSLRMARLSLRLIDKLGYPVASFDAYSYVFHSISPSVVALYCLAGLAAALLIMSESIWAFTRRVST